ncbi:MAG TPA: hypothetical protein VHI52_10735 [Verrucomicrobiae bacterium]|nr:hypothetical protein [Verrucomicrobiae bacterium]
MKSPRILFIDRVLADPNLLLYGSGQVRSDFVVAVIRQVQADVRAGRLKRAEQLHDGIVQLMWAYEPQELGVNLIDLSEYVSLMADAGKAKTKEVSYWSWLASYGAVIVLELGSFARDDLAAVISQS